MPWDDDVPPEGMTPLFDQQAIDLVAETRLVIHLTLTTLAWEPTDPARYLEEALLRVLKRAHVEVSTSVTKEDAPMVRVVTAALALAGINLSTATVSMRLRGLEYARPRSGAPRKRAGVRKTP